ncbi:MAG TPA: GNAT family N-acetyltransferase [Stellaceae bacterium]|nr:GNAT family N-acetyltransferase [Stellaceae bacterium]
MGIVIERAVEATPEVRQLISELDAVLSAEYEPHQRHGLPIERIFEPNMRFFVVRRDGDAVGCGGVALFADYAEVKRMYTRPSARRQGVGKALLRQIEDEARAVSLPVLRLETGTRQPEAIGLYRRFGFRLCGAFGPYASMPPAAIETSLFFEKPIV